MPGMTLMRAWPKLRLILILIACLSSATALALLLRPAPGTPALVLSRDIARGEAFSASQVREVRLPPEAVPHDLIPVDAPLPSRWPGERALAGTVLSESVLAGSALGRGLRPDESLISIALDSTHIPPLEAGDQVDLWGFPETCDATSCNAQRIASSGRISSVAVDEAPAWGSAPIARIDLIVDSAHTEAVLGHAGTGTLSLALTPLPSEPSSDQHRRTQ